MISETLKFLELQKSKVLILIAEYKDLFDILFPYDFITPKNEFASLINDFHLALKQNLKKLSFKIYTFFKKTIHYVNFTLGGLFFLFLGLLQNHVQNASVAQTAFVYVFSVLLAVSKIYFFDKSEEIQEINLESLTLYEKLKRDSLIIETHFKQDFLIIYILGTSVPFFYAIKVVNASLFIFEYQPIFIFWPLFTLLVFFIYRIIIILFANHPVAWKIAGVCLSCIGTTGVVVSSGLEFHKMCLDASYSAPLFKSTLTYNYQYWQTGYSCKNRPDLALGQFYELKTGETPPTLRNGFLNTTKTKSLLEDLPK
jgi:hypothetical protein